MGSGRWLGDMGVWIVWGTHPPLGLHSLFPRGIGFSGRVTCRLGPDDPSACTPTPAWLSPLTPSYPQSLLCGTWHVAD